jgi:hypothetical protein
VKGGATLFLLSLAFALVVLAIRVSTKSSDVPARS